MTLQEYLEKRKAIRLAKRLGWTNSKLSRIRNHLQWPDVGEIVKISDATRNAVKADDWVNEYKRVGCEPLTKGNYNE